MKLYINTIAWLLDKFHLTPLIIGADENTTRRLLIEAGARASEKERNDDEEPWGLISKNPLKDIE